MTGSLDAANDYENRLSLPFTKDCPLPCHLLGKHIPIKTGTEYTLNGYYYTFNHLGMNIVVP